MKHFDRDGKYNFVDANNVLVGFSNSECCCESFGWILSREIPTPQQCRDDFDGISLNDVVNHNFDTSFKSDLGGSTFDEGGAVVFRLTCDGQPDAYLTLYNHHNGYYSHGFSMKDANEAMVYEGSI